ncbi:hypothetical protein, partial [Escherichia coli]|uniref:hypothetical protein n=1 Tax=Escherichia coli TaxID=562 RepID=UPI0021CEF1F4
HRHEEVPRHQRDIQRGGADGKHDPVDADVAHSFVYDGEDGIYQKEEARGLGEGFKGEDVNYRDDI